VADKDNSIDSNNPNRPNDVRRAMPIHIAAPAVIQAADNKSKIIEEYAGLANTKTGAVSIARMISPPGWSEPGQTPEFDEYTVVLKGLLRVRTKNGTYDVRAGQAIIANRGEWVQYSTPGPEGAEYIAVCLPAFSPDRVHRDAAEWYA
jgi:mannose-6-phosphate isomerase-like protein (cupin superfamily)